MTTTLFIVLVMIAVPLGWEFVTLWHQDLDTISRAFMQMGQEWNAFTIYMLSVLVGHFFVQPPAHLSLGSVVTDVGEVVIILWTGWIIFLLFHTYPGWLPLPWWGSLLLILGSVCLGAFGWSLNV